ncbi:MAG TPA: SPOR domain-containing protein [Novosphingobium sp.]|nr:SPOR domain-containing protein [Novosphingobium sp.]HNN54744.1 SPOR domain-containing protein [Novosphingobium sp.]
MSRASLPLRLSVGGVAALLVGAAQVQAQSAPTVSQPVVQAIPGGESMKLNDALNRLAKDPRDVAALVDAGKASLDIGDTDAAIGFFQRAAVLAPADPRAKAGLAGAYIRKKDPFSAIPLFEEAAAVGRLEPDRLADRGLAYDLVGDGAKAQEFYRQSLAQAPSDEAARRLALSQAIAGDRRGMEVTLAPLLQRQDKAAWRTRAFGLAILGYADEADAISRQNLPADKAGAMSAYLRYMPRLTPAQQAAAANLGQFPRAAEIGRDDPRVAQFSRPRAVLAAATPVQPPAAPVAKGKGKTAPAKGRPAPAQQVAVSKPQTEAVAAPPEPQVGREVNGGPIQIASAAPPVQQPQPVAAQTPPVSEPGFSALDPAPGFDLRQSSGAQTAAPQPAAKMPVEANPAPATAAPAAERLEEAFAEFGRPSHAVEPAAGAVDVRKIQPIAKEKPPVEVAAKDTKGKKDEDPCAPAVPTKGKNKAAAKAGKGAQTQCKTGKDAKPKGPSHPSRIWVQVATGKNKKALAFDWRRFLKDEPEAFRGRKGYTSAWGATNRLLTGPFDTEAEAKAFMARLRKAGVDGSFLWTSPAGQVVDALP